MGIYKALEFNTTTDLIDIVPQFDPSLVYPNTVATANQNLAAGALVSLVDISGTIQVVNALALSTSPAPALGFVLTATSVSQPATVFTVGNYVVSGAYTAANVGQTVYLSASLPGQVTLTAPTSPNLIQPVGVIVSVDGSGNATIAWSLDQATAGIVSSVGLSMPPDFLVSNSPITSSGTLNVVWANQGVNLVFAGPSSVGTGDLYGGSSFGSGVYSGNGGTPSWRSLVAADIPNLPASIITSGTLSMTVGGTNANLSATALGDTFYGNVAGSPATPFVARLSGNTTTTKQFLTQTGTGSASAAPAWGTIANSDLPAPLATIASARVTLTALQIQTLASVPVQVLPAPGANLTYMVIQTLAHYRFVSRPYTLGSMENIILSYGTYSSNGPWYVASAPVFLNESTDAYAEGFGGATGYGLGTSPPEVVVNAPLLITADFNPTASGSPPLFGDGTVTLTILYTTVNVTLT